MVLTIWELKLINSRNKISFFTSFETNDNKDQYKTWRKYCYKIYAIQDPKDNFKNKNEYNLILNKSTLFENKSLHKLSDIFRIARLLEGSEKFVIINSNIELNFSSDYWNRICQIANDNIVVGNRFNYKKNKKDCEEHKFGLDFFVINKKLKFFDAPIFMNYWGWDWWIVYSCVAQKIPVVSIDGKNNIFYKTNNDKIEIDLKKENIRKKLIGHIKNV